VKVEKLDPHLEEYNQRVLVAAVSQDNKPKPKPKKTKIGKSKPGRKSGYRILENYIHNGVRVDVQHEIDRITMLKHRSLSIKRTQQILDEVCALHNRFIKKHNESFGTKFRKYLPSPRDDEYFMQQETIMLIEDMMDIQLTEKYDMATCEKLLAELQYSVRKTSDEETLQDGCQITEFRYCGLADRFEKLKIDMLDKMSELRALEENMRDSCNVRVTPDSDNCSMPAKRMKIDKIIQESENPKKISFTPESLKRKDLSQSILPNTNEFKKPTIPATKRNLN
jgi:hypothetical protein